MNIKDKVAIITGGCGGIGFATVQVLLTHGAKYAAIFDQDSMHTRATFCTQKIEQQFGKGRADFYTCDVTIQSEFAARYDEIVGMQGSVDILVNCVNLVNELRTQHMVDTNLTAVINSTLIGIDRMGYHHNGKGGAIVNVASVFGLKTSAALPIFTATKHGVCGFTKSLKDHYEDLGVRVMALCPGLTESSFLHHNLREETLKFISDKYLIEIFECSKYIQQPENVGTAVIKMIQNAEAGDIWISEDDEPAYAIADPQPYKERRVLV